MTPYSNASLGDFDIFDENISSHSSFENSFIGFRDFITHITYPLSLKSTVFEILRLKNPEYFFRESDYFNRLSFDTLELPENVIISTQNGLVRAYSNNVIPDIISILLQFRHTLMIPVIHRLSAIKVLDDITSDTSNGVNDLLDGFD
ncbi:hypothetical protein [Pectobacterium brasiliense]|uniref:hypothetical protein n=1 Tax=Pectobacterium brasiliense TaxID=180957 RepID=UPI001F079FE7|nr:hypothetical protein [Pectobacterium brasiliense]